MRQTSPARSPRLRTLFPDYWRIDSQTTSGDVIVGDVWSFSVNLIADEQSISFTTVADGSVRAGDNSQILYGFEDSLDLDYDTHVTAHIYTKFIIDALPEGADITHADLVLTTMNDGAPRSAGNVYAVSSDWSEVNMSWSSAPVTDVTTLAPLDSFDAILNAEC